MPFGNSIIGVLAAAPLGVLTAVGLLGDVPGEWGRAALLAYASVLLGSLTGIGAGGAALPMPASVLTVSGLFMAFAALSLGGPWGHALQVMSYAALTVLAWRRPNIGVPWPLALAGGIACLITLVRTALG